MSIPMQEKAGSKPGQTKALPLFWSNFIPSLAVIGLVLSMATVASNSSIAAGNKYGDNYRSSGNAKLVAKKGKKLSISRGTLRKRCGNVGGDFHSAPGGYSCVTKSGTVECAKGKGRKSNCQVFRN